MYSVLPSFVLGFHGCDKEIAEEIFAGKSVLKPSTNEWDWLGHGVYFWENNPQRALEYAKEVQLRSGKVGDPEVVGAVIDLRNCLNFLESNSIQLLKEAYGLYVDSCSEEGITPAQNRNVGDNTDLLLRNLDCAVIQMLHAYRDFSQRPAFDSVRGMFMEGVPLYEKAGVHDKNHIQLCVRNPNCIKGYFRVMNPDDNWPVT